MTNEISNRKPEVPSTWFRRDTDWQWEKHVEQMNHCDYPYRDIHWDTIVKYGAQDLPFGLWEGGMKHQDFCSIIDTPEDIEYVFEKTVTKRGDRETSELLPHFVALKNPASMFYLLSFPRSECSNDVERAIRTQVAQWIYVQNQDEHPEKLWATTHFHSKFWSDTQVGDFSRIGFGGFLTYGIDIINPPSREEDKCTMRAYEGNKVRIQRLVSDTAKFCGIVRSDREYDEKKKNGYLKLERTVGKQIDDLARAIAQSPSPDSIFYLANLARYNQGPMPTLPVQICRTRRRLITKIRGLLR